MKLNLNKKYATISVYAFVVIVAAMLFYNIVSDIAPLTKYFKMVADLLMPFAIGAALAFVLNPILKFCEQTIFPKLFRGKLSRKSSRTLGIVISYVFMFLLVVLFGLIVLPQIAVSVKTLLDQSSFYIEEARVFMNYIIANYGDNPMVNEVLQRLIASAETIVQRGYALISDLIPMVANIVINLTNSVFDAIMGLIISVYVLLSKETFAAQIKKLLTAFFSSKSVDTMLSIAHDSNEIFCGFISGKILDSLIIGLICFIGTSIMKTPYAVLVSVIVGVTNVIPYFGPFIGAIPSIILILFADPIQAIYFSIFILFLQQLDGNVIGPKILGDSTGLSAFWVVFSVTFFGGMFGFVGMLIGVPTFAVIYSLIRRLAEHNLREKDLPTDTRAYASPNLPLMEESKKPKSSKKNNPPVQKGNK